MSSINPLGQLFNASGSVTTTGKRVNLRDCSGVGFFLVSASATTTVTISEANAASGGTSQTLAGTFDYWTQAATGGVWTKGVGGVNGTSITSINAAGGLLYCWVSQGALSDGFSYLSASHATGTFVYLLSPLEVQRRPVNLVNVTA